MNTTKLQDNWSHSRQTKSQNHLMISQSVTSNGNIIQESNDRHGSHTDEIQSQKQTKKWQNKQEVHRWMSSFLEIPTE